MTTQQRILEENQAKHRVRQLRAQLANAPYRERGRITLELAQAESQLDAIRSQARQDYPLHARMRDELTERFGADIAQQVVRAARKRMKLEEVSGLRQRFIEVRR